MKKIFSILFLSWYFMLQGYAQNRNYVVIEYQLSNNTERPNTYFTTLAISGNTSVFQEKRSTTQWAKVALPTGAMTKKSTISFEPYLKVDRKKREILLFDIIGTNIFLVKDTYNELKWDIDTDIKQIGGYNCIKATTSYRGRQWEAWFTPDCLAVWAVETSWAARPYT